MDLTSHNRAGAEEHIVLPCGVAVVLRVLEQGAIDLALRQATKVTGITTDFGLAVNRNLQTEANSAARKTTTGKQAVKDRAAAEKALIEVAAALEKKPDDATAKAKQAAATAAFEAATAATRVEVNTCHARAKWLLGKRDPEALQALGDLETWNAEAMLQVAGVGLVECAQLAEGLPAGAPDDAPRPTWRAATPADAVERLRRISDPESQATFIGELFGTIKALARRGSLGKARSESPSGSDTGKDGTPGSRAATDAEEPA